MENKKVLTEEIIPALKEKVEQKGGAKLYSGYGNNTDGAVTQKFISEKLNGIGLALGIGATTNGGVGIAIGNYSSNYRGTNNDGDVTIGVNAKTSAHHSVAIGNNTNVSRIYSVALGSESSVNRDNECSIGSTSHTRYLANVRPGELDTDAVNVKQLNEALHEPTVLYELPVDSISAPVSMISLNESMFNFEYVKIFSILNPAYLTQGSNCGQTYVTRYDPEIAKKQYELSAAQDSNSITLFGAPGGFTISGQYYDFDEMAGKTAMEVMTFTPPSFNYTKPADADGTKLYDQGSLEGGPSKRKFIITKILAYNRIASTA